jgi:hypothetical protein
VAAIHAAETHRLVTEVVTGHDSGVVAFGGSVDDEKAAVSLRLPGANCPEWFSEPAASS